MTTWESNASIHCARLHFGWGYPTRSVTFGIWEPTDGWVGMLLAFCTFSAIIHNAPYFLTRTNLVHSGWAPYHYVFDTWSGCYIPWWIEITSFRVLNRMWTFLKSKISHSKLFILQTRRDNFFHCIRSFRCKSSNRNTIIKVLR
jgi:hypothetical protein